MAMGSNNTQQLQLLPKIDFTDEEGLVPGSRGWDGLRGQVREALESHGCFEAVYDGVPPELRDAIFSAMKELFSLPLETKMRNRSDKGYRGYIGQVPYITCESLGFEDPDLPEAAQSFTHLMWPQGNPSFCETVNRYAKKLSELDKMVRRMVLESLGLDKKYYQSHMESAKYHLRLSEYSPPQSPEATLGLVPHVDANTITIIYPNQVRGLEVQTKDGDWISIDPKPNSFIVMNGASFQAWSNGRLHAPRHQVTCTGSKETRYSVMLFVIPKDESVIETPKELVDEEHPRLYKPFKYPDYVKYSHTVEGYQAKCPLTAYCGLANPQV